MDKNKKGKKSFEKQMLATGSVPNLAAGAVVIGYVTFFAGLSGANIGPVVLLGVLVALFLQFVVAPLTNKALTKRLSDDLEEWENYPSTERERTRLLKRVMSCPQRIALQVFIVFSGGVVFWTTSFGWLFHMAQETVILASVAAVTASFTAGVLSMSFSQKLCSGYGCRLVEQGVDRAEVERRHTFGLSSVSMVTVHVLLPIVIINGISLMMAWRATVFTDISVGRQIVQLAAVCLFNLAISLSLSCMIYRRMMASIRGMRRMLEAMDDGSLHSIKKSPTDLSNDFMYNVYLINQIIDLVQTMLRQSTEISDLVVSSSSELSAVSRETDVTSLQQAAGVRELLATMEDSDALSRGIATKISEVAVVAAKMAQDVADGYGILEQNMRKLDEIRRSNETTAAGIKALGERISGISDIALIINSIADQTNIIAFTAELEASNAGDGGKNFYLVASEIRRLTNNVIESTKEIRDRIKEIQRTSETLLQTSQDGSRRIQEGGRISDELKCNFDAIRDSSVATDEAAANIKLIIQQQTAAFEQIVVTLRQISGGVESFSGSTHMISQQAAELCRMAENLKLVFSLDESGSEKPQQKQEAAL